MMQSQMRGSLNRRRHIEKAMHAKALHGNVYDLEHPKIKRRRRCEAVSSDDSRMHVNAPLPRTVRWKAERVTLEIASTLLDLSIRCTVHKRQCKARCVSMDRRRDIEKAMFVKALHGNVHDLGHPKIKWGRHQSRQKTSDQMTFDQDQ